MVEARTGVLLMVRVYTENTVTKTSAWLVAVSNPQNKEDVDRRLYPYSPDPTERVSCAEVSKESLLELVAFVEAGNAHGEDYAIFIATQVNGTAENAKVNAFLLAEKRTDAHSFAFGNFLWDYKTDGTVTIQDISLESAIEFAEFARSRKEIKNDRRDE